jgi:multidrug efflux pump subunit AcrA (membrane-fusion protein)
MFTIAGVTTFFRSLTRKQLIVYGSALFVSVVVISVYLSGSTGPSTEILVSPKRSEFLVTVTTTGELQAKNSIEIKGPSNAQAAGIWQMKIGKIVPEGTVVKTGDFVAELDKADIANKLRDSELSVQKLEAQYSQAKLDSTLALAQARDELVNLQFAREEKQIAYDQSTYEAPAVRRQAQIDYDRAVRTYEQATKSYVTKTKQSIAKIQAVEADLMKDRGKLTMMNAALQQFTIMAPANGMVVYTREWNGKKKTVGSQVSPWDATVATLPDLRTMESITYVNEIDIQKIQKGQSVKLRLDADPKKILTGIITQVANIGEQRPNSDSKVFEVKITVNEVDTTLRPSMTTANEILVAKIPAALSIPLEAVHTEGNATFAFVRNGSVRKQEVKLGIQNETEAVVLEGISEHDEVYLSTPNGAPGMGLIPLPTKR